MVGKPKFPEDVDVRGDRRGSAVGTPGLTALDEEREASLADEGGASGATIESQDLETLRRLAEELPVAHLQSAETADDVTDDDEFDEHDEEFHDAGELPRMTVLIAAVSFAAAAFGVFAYRRWVA